MARVKKATGQEPVYEGEKLGTPEYKRKLTDVLNFNNYAFTSKDLMKHVESYAKEKQMDAEFIKEWKKYGAKYTGTTVGSTAKFSAQGAPLADVHADFVETRMKKAIALGRKKSNGTEEDDNKPKVKVLTIQDRLKIQLNNFLTDIAHIEDKVIDGEKHKKGEIAEYLQKSEVPVVSAPKISSYYARVLAEITEAKAKTCEQLTEGYKHLKVADYNRLIAFYTDLIAECDHYTASKKAQRKLKPRKVKPKSKEKLVEKLKYKTQDDVTKLVSISPTKIIGASMLWVYNTKTRKLGCYVADDMLGPLTVKGTSIVGFDEIDSIQKTIKKPAEVLAEFKKMSRAKLKKLLPSISTINLKLTGRLNNQTIILKAY